jgi:hypothetical protein
MVFVLGAEEACRQRYLATNLAQAAASSREQGRKQAQLLHQMHDRLAALEKERASLAGEIERVRAKNAATETNAQTPKPATAEMLLTAELLELFWKSHLRERDPVVQQHQLQKGRAQMNSDYSPLFRRLHLTPAQVGQFLDATSRQYETSLDLTAIVKAQNLSREDPLIERLRKQADDACQTEISAMLGPESYAAYRDYERTISVRPMAADLVGAATLQGVPLTSAQTEELVQTIADGSVRYRDGGSVKLADIDWNAVDAKAAGFLSPSQLELLRAKEDRYFPRFRDLLNQARAAEKLSDGFSP